MKCKYGCLQEAMHKDRCDISWNRCPVNITKNSGGLTKNWLSGNYKDRYKNTSQESRDKMMWSKGLTSELDARICSGKDHHLFGTGPGKGRVWTDASKKKASISRSEWLKIPENRRNYGRGSRSWMEQEFNFYLLKHNYTFQEEYHIINKRDNKNYFVDFYVEELNLLIELDGTQHRNTVEQDKARDLYLIKQGYRILRIPYKEFRFRLYNDGFLDLLGN